MDCWVHVLKEKQCGVNFSHKQTRQRDIHIALKNYNLSSKIVSSKPISAISDPYTNVARVLSRRSCWWVASAFTIVPCVIPFAATYTICNVLHGSSSRQKNEQQNHAPNPWKQCSRRSIAPFSLLVQCFVRVDFQAQNDPRMKEAEIMSIPVIGGAGSWGGNSASGVEENPMVRFRWCITTNLLFDIWSFLP